jgi:spermidine synthase
MDGVLERTQGLGGELVLRVRDGVFEIIENGVFLMDTRDGRSERLLVAAAADAMPPAGRMVIAGLGVGFSLDEALHRSAVREVHVVEREEAVVRWNRGPLAAVHGGALRDDRVRVHRADVVDWLDEAEPSAFDALCLDVDNGPDWTVTPSNADLYRDAGLARVARVLTPGGVLTVWCAAPAPELEARLASHFGSVHSLEVPVARGRPDVVVVACGPLRSD